MCGDQLLDATSFEIIICNKRGKSLS